MFFKVLAGTWADLMVTGASLAHFIGHREKCLRKEQAMLDFRIG